MKIITIEEHYMSEKVNDRFMELNQPKDEVQANQEAFVKLFIRQRFLQSFANTIMKAAGTAGRQTPLRALVSDGITILPCT